MKNKYLLTIFLALITMISAFVVGSYLYVDKKVNVTLSEVVQNIPQNVKERRECYDDWGMQYYVDDQCNKDDWNTYILQKGDDYGGDGEKTIIVPVDEKTSVEQLKAMTMADRAKVKICAIPTITLHDAVKTRYRETVERFLNQPRPMNEPLSKDGFISKEFYDKIQVFKDKCPYERYIAYMRDSYEYCKGCTPLIIATIEGNFGIVYTLLRNGADPNATDAAGRTALMYATISGNSDVVSILLDKGANPNKIGQRSTDNEETALFNAVAFMYKMSDCYYGDNCSRAGRIVKDLLKHGANINETVKRNGVLTSPFIIAAIDQQNWYVVSSMAAYADPKEVVRAYEIAKRFNANNEVLLELTRHYTKKENK